MKGILSNNIYNNSVCVCVKVSMYTAQSTIEGYNICGWVSFLVKYE